MAINGAKTLCECACGCRAKVDGYVGRTKPLCSSCAAGACVASAPSTADLRETERALRAAALPHVEALVAGLMAQGMTKEKAISTIGWAYHTLKGRK